MKEIERVAKIRNEHGPRSREDCLRMAKQAAYMDDCEGLGKLEVIPAHASDIIDKIKGFATLKFDMEGCPPTKYNIDKAIKFFLKFKLYKYKVEVFHGDYGEIAISIFNKDKFIEIEFNYNNLIHIWVEDKYTQEEIYEKYDMENTEAEKELEKILKEFLNG